jgi:hypothetical protein
MFLLGLEELGRKMNAETQMDRGNSRGHTVEILISVSAFICGSLFLIVQLPLQSAKGRVKGPWEIKGDMVLLIVFEGVPSPAS